MNKTKRRNRRRARANASDDLEKPPAERIETAFRALGILPEREDCVPRLAHRLALLADRPPAPPPEPFRAVGARRTRDELELIINTEAAELPDILARVHATTIGALANAGFVRSDDPRRAADAARRAIDAPPSTPSPAIVAINRRHIEPSYWQDHDWWEYAPTPPVRSLWEPPSEGRPRDELARTVAVIVLADYELLTGESATSRNRSGLGRLLRDVFAVLELKANVRSAMAEAAKVLDSRKIQSTRGFLRNHK